MTQPLHYQHWPAQLPKKLKLRNIALHDCLRLAAQKNPAKAATIFYGAELSYREALKQVEAMAGHLQKNCGVRKGDRVILQMQNCPQYLLAYNAILSTGAVVVAVNPMNVTEELRHYAKDSEVACAIVSQELAPNLIPLLEDGTIDHVISATYRHYLPENPEFEVSEVFSAPQVLFQQANIDYWQDIIESNLPFSKVDVQPQDNCLLLYTSGSTGAPKGCLHTHSSALAAVDFGTHWQQLDDQSVGLAVVPFFHVTGMQQVMNAIINAGATLVILPRWDAVAAATMVERYRCSHWINVPVMVVDMLNNGAAMNHDISSLRFIMGGGSAMPEAVAAKLKELCDVEYIEGYGLSESASGGILNPTNRPKRQCLGIPWFNTQARIVDPETLEPLAIGEQGEIIFTSPQVFKGYWNNDKATKETLIEIDGETWLRTGDLGYMDQDGYFFITDRIKRMINAAGYKVWPAEVETTLFKHPDIKAACIISTPDKRRGESVKAVVVLKDGRELNEETLISWSREQLATYKVPRSVEFVDALPLTATGKVNWRSLQEQEQ